MFPDDTRDREIVKQEDDAGRALGMLAYSETVTDVLKQENVGTLHLVPCQQTSRFTNDYVQCSNQEQE